jgi:hypothetical protein
MRVQRAQVADAAALAPCLRESDLREIQAVYGKPPAVVLARGIAQSEHCYIVIDESGDPIALFGVISAAQPGVGIPWMVASRTLAQHVAFVARNSRKWLTILQCGYTELWNCLDARNLEDLRWVQWCGFTVTETIAEYGVEKRPFVAFRRISQEHERNPARH